MDRREITLEVVDAELTSAATWRSLEEFAARVRDVLVEDGVRFDSARQSLRHEFGVVVTQSRIVFASA